MKSLHERKIKDGARAFLDEDEEVLAAFVARPRGWTMAAAGSIHAGAELQGRAHAAGEATGFRLASPMALALTRRRLLSLQISSPLGLGVGGKVKGLVSAVPIEAVDAIGVRRLALGQVVTLTIAGWALELEANAAAGATALAAAFDQMRP